MMLIIIGVIVIALAISISLIFEPKSETVGDAGLYAYLLFGVGLACVALWLMLTAIESVIT